MTETAGLTTLCNPAGGAEPQSTPDGRAAAASSLSPRMLRARNKHAARREQLTFSARRALLILLDDGPLRPRGADWLSPGGEKVGGSTLESLFDRYLVKVIAENAHRVRVTARLTEIGERVARDLKRESHLLAGAIA